MSTVDLILVPRQYESISTILVRLVRPPWSEEDDFHIRTVIQQYSSAPPSCRRALCIDCLMRCLPHKTRDELVGMDSQSCILELFLFVIVLTIILLGSRLGRWLPVASYLLFLVWHGLCLVRLHYITVYSIICHSS